MSTAVPRSRATFDVSNGIHTSHRLTDGAHYMPGCVYNFQGCASFTPSLGPRDGLRLLPPPRQPVSLSLVLSRHGRTDVMADERCTWRMDGRWPDARTTLDTCVLGGRTTAPAHQRRQPPQSLPNDTDHRAGRPPHTATWASLPDTRCLDHRP